MLSGAALIDLELPEKLFLQGQGFASPVEAFICRLEILFELREIAGFGPAIDGGVLAVGLA